MRARGVVVDAPSLDDAARLREPGEHMLVQTLVPQLAVEALHEAVLLRFAGRDVVPLDAVVLGPLEHGIAGELSAVVGDDHLRLATLGHDPIEHTGDPWTRQRGIDLGGKSVAGKLVLDVEYPGIAGRSPACPT